MTKSILVIGANGRIGQQLLRSISSSGVHSGSEQRPALHAFVRRPKSLPEPLVTVCDSVQKGDALRVDDVYNALITTEATHVVVAIGVPNSTKKSTLREESAKTLVEAMQRSGRQTRVVLVSSIGAGNTRIRLGFGIGLTLSIYLRHVLSDHTRQEQCFDSFFQGRKKDLLIVRPTALVDGKGGKKLVLFDGADRTPSGQVDRSDVARWIAEQIAKDDHRFGQTVNITAAPA
ncbi:NAD(P)H-binding protein [Gracilaria domingensis]|nr:NAD(P)H-binding protein [Gracilaria domingensis]